MAAVYLLESAICMAILYGFYALVLRRETFFQLNRCYLLAAALLSFVLPALHIPLEKNAPAASNSRHAELLTPLPEVVETVQAAPATLQRELLAPSPAGLSMADLLWIIYLTGAAFFLGRMCLRFYRLWRLLRQSRLEKMGDVKIAYTQTNTLASFFGYIIWPEKADYTPETARILLAHERAHARDRHSLDVLLMELLLVLQWFNPLMHAFCRSLRTVHEYIADRAVLRSRQGNLLIYAQLLVQESAGAMPVQLTPVNTFHSQLKLRLRMLARRPSSAFQRGKYLLALPIGAVLMLLFSFRLVDTLPLAAPIRTLSNFVQQYAESLEQHPVDPDPVVPPPFFEPTPYIFYWGVLQCKLERESQSGQVYGSIECSAVEFREALKREPRIWNGKSLEQHLSFELERLKVSSDYNNEQLYAGQRKSLEELCGTLPDDAVLHIRNLRLPDGSIASIELLPGGKTPSWLPAKNGEINARVIESPGISEFPVRWGAAYDDEQLFFTEDEFWKIIQEQPEIIKNNQPIRVDSVKLRINDWAQNQSILLPTTEYQSLESACERLHELKDQIKPGVSIHLSAGMHLSTPVYDTIIYLYRTPDIYMRNILTNTIGHFRIVAEDDPRRTLRRSQSNDFVLEWGNFNSTRIFDRFAKVFTQPDGSVIVPDAPYTYNNFMHTRRELLEMMRLPRRLYREQELLGSFACEIVYKAQRYEIPVEGTPPALLLERLEKELQPGDKLSIEMIRAGNADLRSVQLLLEVRSEDPKPPLRPASADAATDLNISLSPNPASAYTYLLAETSGNGLVQVHDATGRLVLERNVSIADPKTPLRLDFNLEKGLYTLTLRMDKGTIGTQKLAVQ
jgi:beta-lactamase regulating signal transducer with metallopeptidase domain